MLGKHSQSVKTLIISNKDRCKTKEQYSGKCITGCYKEMVNWIEISRGKNRVISPSLFIPPWFHICSILAFVSTWLLDRWKQWRSYFQNQNKLIQIREISQKFLFRKMDKAIDSCKLNPDIGGCKHFSSWTYFM